MSQKSTNRKTDLEIISDRANRLYMIFIGLGLMTVVWLVAVQWGANGQPLRNLANKEVYNTKTMKAVRGVIYGTDIKTGELTVLACNMPYYNKKFDFSIINEINKEAKRGDKGAVDTLIKYRTQIIASLEDIYPNHSTTEIAQQFDRVLNTVKSRSGAWKSQKFFNEKVSQQQLDKIYKMPVVAENRSIVGDDDNIQPRYYPFGAKSIIGNNTFTRGIEYAFNELLRGTDGELKQVRLYNKEWIRDNSPDNTDAVNGCDVVTTIDIQMQDIVESELRKVMQNSQRAYSMGAVDGTAIVMDVSTGDIKAVANLHRQDNGSFVDTQNNAITMRTSPGSTFKLVPLLALLENGWNIDEIVDCGAGRYEVPYRKTPIKDSHVVGKTTIERIFAESSNIGFVKMIDKKFGRNTEQYVDFIHSLKLFDDTLTMQLKGSVMPANVPTGKIPAWQLSSLSYGYWIEMTPLYTLTLYNAVANGGRMVAPRLVREIRRDGKVVKHYDVRTINEAVCSPRTLALVKKYMTAVVSGEPRRTEYKDMNGNSLVAHVTGAGARSSRYTVAGKTGTAQDLATVDKKNGGIYYLASFVGYFPADNPEYTVIVAVRNYYRPNMGVGADIYGSQYGVPVFRDVANQIFSTFSSRSTGLDTMRGSNVRAVVSQRAGAGITVFSGVMPDVRGLGLSEAVYLLERRLGVTVSVSGYGAVVEQYPVAGDTVKAGSNVKIRLAALN